MTIRFAIATHTPQGLDSPVSEHFGRCAYFTLADVDPDSAEIRSVSVIDNPFARNHGPGQVPELILNHGATVLLAGGIGRRAITFFEQSGIEVAAGAVGTARQAIQAYLGGQLQGASPCADSQRHHGG